MPPAYTYYFVAATPSNGIKKTDVTRWLLFDYIHCILCPLLYYIGVAGSSPLNYSLIGKRSWNAQTVKKVPSSRHGARPQGRVHGSALNFVPRDCEAEARPADETAEAEQGQRSAFCKPAVTGAAKAGNRNHQGEGISVPRMRAEMGPPWSVSLWRHAARLPGKSRRGLPFRPAAGPARCGPPPCGWPAKSGPRRPRARGRAAARRGWCSPSPPAGS